MTRLVLNRKFINRFLFKDTNSSEPFFKIDNFILLFYTIYILIALSGSLIIKYSSLNLFVIIIFMIYAILLAYGASFGIKLPKTKSLKISIKRINLLLTFCFIFISLILLYSWKLIINHYGLLSYVLTNASKIREENIGTSESIVPFYFSYAFSTYFAFFCISLALLKNTKKPIYIFFSIGFFILILLGDLTTFGRIGTLFAIFSVFGFLIISRKKVIKLKTFGILFLLYGFLSLPRLIRGQFDNFKATVNVFSEFFRIKIHPFFYSFISVFIAYFSSIYALSQYLQNDYKLTYGKRLFTPIFNYLYRFIFPEARISLIDNPVKIPFTFNIYSIVKDIISDFGYIGILIIPIVFGILIGYIFRYQGIFFDALKIFILGWLFYTPIYNVLSFGSFFISFIFLFLMAVVFKIKFKNCE